MSNQQKSDLGLFLEILQTFEKIEVPSSLYDEWCARPEDVIIGKLMAWTEGRSRKHETDIYEMMVFQYLGGNPEHSFVEGMIDQSAATLGAEVTQFWFAIKEAARKESHH